VDALLQIEVVDGFAVSLAETGEGDRVLLDDYN